MRFIHTLVLTSLPLLVLAQGDGVYHPLSAEGLARLNDLKSKVCARQKKQNGGMKAVGPQTAQVAPVSPPPSTATTIVAAPNAAQDSNYQDSTATAVVEAAKISHTTAAAPADPSPSPNPPSTPAGADGDSSRGSSGDTSVSSGPNGAEDFFNRGISSSSPDGGWNPPELRMDQLKTISLDDALAMSNSPFSACAPYASLFKRYGDANGIAPIILASFAMQESSCKADAVGDHGGAFGLMQITQEKCAGSSNCSDPDFNIGVGAKYFADVLAQSGGNVLLALGTYNGWTRGMSFNSANAIKSQCCQCVNNLDYLQQFLNGWVLGLDGSNFGTYRNAIC